MTANLHIVANPANSENNTLVLDGNNLKLLSIKIDNKELSNTDFTVNETN